MIAMRDRAIVSVAIREPYVSRGKVLTKSILKFGCCYYFKVWDVWPPDSPTHQTHHYAFKYFALKAAAELGFRKLLWLDSAAIALSSMEPIWKELEDEGHIFFPDIEPLGRWCSDQALARYGVSRDEAMELKLFCGSWIGINLDSPPAASFFDEWGSLAKIVGGPFMGSHSEPTPDKMRSVPYSNGPRRELISSDPRCLGHRSDEAYFSLMAHTRRMKTTTRGHFNSDECIVKSQLA
jgi:hypothetical protein